MRKNNKRGYVVVVCGNIKSWHLHLKPARTAARRFGAAATVATLPEKDSGSFHIGDVVNIDDDGYVEHYSTVSP